MEASLEHGGRARPTHLVDAVLAERRRLRDESAVVHARRLCLVEDGVPERLPVGGHKGTTALGDTGRATRAAARAEALLGLSSEDEHVQAGRRRRRRRIEARARVASREAAGRLRRGRRGGRACGGGGAVFEREADEVVEVGLEIIERREDEKKALLGGALGGGPLPRDDELLLALAQVRAHREVAALVARVPEQDGGLGDGLAKELLRVTEHGEHLGLRQRELGEQILDESDLLLLRRGSRLRGKLAQGGQHELLVLLDDVVLAVGGDLLGLALHAQVLGRHERRELLEHVEDGRIHVRVHAEQV